LSLKKHTLMKYFIYYLLLIATFSVSAQVSINTNGAAPDDSSMLDVQSTDKGILIPRMDETAMNNIATPATGLMIYNTTDNVFYYYDGATWLPIGDGIADEDWTIDGNDLYNNNSGNVGVGTNAPTTKLDVNGEIKHGNALNLYSNAGNGTHAWVRFNSPSNGWGDNVFLSGGGTTVVGAGESPVYVKNNIDITNGHEILYLTSDHKDNSEAIKFITNLQDNVWDDRVEAVTILGNGKIGIGLNDPTGTLHIASTNDAGPNGSGNPGADLVIGNIDGQHLEIDDNEIHAMSNATDGSVLYLNDHGELVQFGAVIRIKPSATPSSPSDGTIYFDSTTKKMRCYSGGAWHDLW